MTDSEISRGCRQNDPRAWRRLVASYTPLVYRVAVRILNDGPEAEDVSQEVFLRVHRYIDRHDPTRPLAPWLARITYNACLKRLAKLKKVAQEEPLADGENPGNPWDITPESELGQKETEQSVLKALERLSAQDRALVILRYREGFTHGEIAESTRLPVGTIKSRLHRARGKLKTVLAPLLKEVTI